MVETVLKGEVAESDKLVMNACLRTCKLELQRILSAQSSEVPPPGLSTPRLSSSQEGEKQVFFFFFEFHSVFCSPFLVSLFLSFSLGGFFTSLWFF